MGWFNKEDSTTEDLDETLKAELAALQPNDAERARLHAISLLLLLLSLFVGLPLWWMTTTPEQHSLPEDMISQLAHQRITISLDVRTPPSHYAHLFHILLFSFFVHSSCCC
ncbi:unnamed protein product [Dibothriocephalus latus]|uniref:Uncharacterized protein n=1 Tax=Dibothriocephalus latus TaxID=60516 RepID=A0A3P7RDG8_DIBLA|nr:unnamed protein product [Dibothriocephalus latus]